MKKLIIAVAVVVIFLSVSAVAFAEWSFGIETGGYGTPDVSWRGGGTYKLYSQDFPVMRKSQLSWYVAGWVKNDSFELPWDLESIGRVKYIESIHFDFRQWRHPLLNFGPRMISASVGVNKEYKGFNFFGLVGASWLGHYRGTFIELRPVGILNHGSGNNISSVVPEFTFGANYLIDCEYFKIGPQAGVDIFPVPHGLKQCRKLKMGRYHPWFGIVTWF